VFDRAIVPLVVIVPPVSPVPAVTPVTVPVGAEAGDVLVIVRLPATPVIEMPGPALREMTPEFARVTLPVLAEAEIPGPAEIVTTPPDPPRATSSPVRELTPRPAPTINGP
jgi:hypothetical protein